MKLKEATSTPDSGSSDGVVAEIFEKKSGVETVRTTPIEV
jgi:hypothetical protein